MKLLLRIVYNIIYLTLAHFAVALFLIVNPKRCLRELKTSTYQRFGFYPAFQKTKPVVIFRCASLGEARVASKIISSFNEYFKVLCVGTASSYEYALENKLGDLVVFTPPDFYSFTKNFFGHFKPSLVFLIESELWPEFLWSAKDCRCKVYLVNGRFSPRSILAFMKLKSIFRVIFSNVDGFLVRYSSDAEVLRVIGVGNNKIKITGNLKYSFEKTEEFKRHELGFSNNDFIIVASSTHKEDEEVIADVFEELKEKYNNVKIIIVPRHVERYTQSMALFKDSAVFQVTGKIDSSKKSFIVNKVGILDKIYPVSDLVIVGGSFGRRGGQDPITATFFSKVVIFGPCMQNFLSEVNSLLQAGGAFQVKNKKELLEKIIFLIENPQHRYIMGENAKKSALENLEAKDRTLNYLKEMMLC